MKCSNLGALLTALFILSLLCYLAFICQLLYVFLVLLIDVVKMKTHKDRTQVHKPTHTYTDIYLYRRR